jgi:hypothetical protein
VVRQFEFGQAAAAAAATAAGVQSMLYDVFPKHIADTLLAGKKVPGAAPNPPRTGSFATPHPRRNGSGGLHTPQRKVSIPRSGVLDGQVVRVYSASRGGWGLRRCPLKQHRRPDADAPDT